MSFKDSIGDLFNQAQRIFWQRNSLYGTNNIVETGAAGVVARLKDKLERAKNLVDGAVNTSDEALIDTALDIANYGIILASLADGSWPSSNAGKRIQILRSGHTNISLPQLAGDVGFDLCCSVDTQLQKGKVTYVPTGVRIKCPDGMWLRIVGRSSLARKRHILCVEGVIDNGYTGELAVGMTPIGDETMILAGERIAQGIFCPILIPDHVIVGELPDTPRGAAGFGSTGGHK